MLRMVKLNNTMQALRPYPCDSQLILRTRLPELFTHNYGAAGRRSIMFMIRENGRNI